jgi:uncharacterized membrane protein YgcG
MSSSSRPAFPARKKRRQAHVARAPTEQRSPGIENASSDGQKVMQGPVVVRPSQHWQSTHAQRSTVTWTSVTMTLAIAAALAVGLLRGSHVFLGDGTLASCKLGAPISACLWRLAEVARNQLLGYWKVIRATERAASAWGGATGGSSVPEGKKARAPDDRQHERVVGPAFGTFPVGCRWRTVHWRDPKIKKRVPPPASDTSRSSGSVEYEYFWHGYDTTSGSQTGGPGAGRPKERSNGAGLSSGGGGIGSGGGVTESLGAQDEHGVWRQEMPPACSPTGFDASSAPDGWDFRNGTPRSEVSCDRHSCSQQNVLYNNGRWCVRAMVHDE